MFDLKSRILDGRKVIRWHFYQEGDDRCWADDFLVYKVILGISEPVALPYDRCMALCRQYHDQRSTKIALVQIRISSPSVNCDHDLIDADAAKLAYVWAQIHGEAMVHYRIGDGNRTAADDQRLYEVLPEARLIAANQYLPPWEVFGPSCDRFIGSRDPRQPDWHSW